MWHYEVDIDGRVRQVSVQKTDGRFEVTVDGRTRIVDVARLNAHVWSLLLEQQGPASASSREVSIGPGPGPGPGRLAVQVGSTLLTASLNGRRRWGRKDTGGRPGTGPQQVLASMSGKVVRLLVKPGDAVRARQPVVVVEAMKMENELSAAHDGTVAEVKVRNGQSVDAGALLVVIV